MSEESKKRFFSEITKAEALDNGVVSLAIRPNQPSNYGQGSLSGKQLQERFDRLAGLIIERYNEMAAGLSSDEVLEYFKLPKVDGDYITLPNGAIDISSFIKNISDGDGNLIVETPYVEDKDTIKSILAKLFSDISTVDAFVCRNEVDKSGNIHTVISVDISKHDGTATAHAPMRAVISQEIDDDIAKHNVATDTHADIRALVPAEISKHDGTATAHAEMRAVISKEVEDDISAHNINANAHADIRETLNNLYAFVTGAADEDDDLFENINEIVSFIQKNKGLIDSLRDDKIDKTSIVTNLTTEDSTKVLAASVGKVIIEAINQAVTDKVTNNSLSKTLSEYLKKGELGDIIRPDDLKNYIDVDELAKALEPYAKTNDIVIPDVSGFIDTDALNKALEDYAKTGDIPDVSKFIDTDALNNVLKGYVKSGDINLDNYLTIDDLQGYVQEGDDPVVRESDLEGYAKEESNGDPVVRQNALDDQLENYALETDAAGSVVREKANNPVIKQDALDRALAGFTGGSSQFTDAFAAELLRLFGTNGTKGLSYYINGLAGVGRAWCCGKGESTETDITIGYLAEGCAVYVVRGFGETDITSVVIPEGITIIESNTFNNCTSLTQVTLPDSLNTIGIRAFEKCDNLKYIHISDIAKWCRIIFDDGVSQPLQNEKCKLCINGIILEDLVIPDNVKEISQLAFYGYQFLKSVVINDVVTELYANTFYHCSNLKSITLGKGINNIVRSPVMPIFNACSSLENIIVNEENAYYKSIDGNLYERENSAIMQYAVGKKDASFLLPDNVERIGHDAFHSAANLISVRLRGNLHEIGDRAFEGCSNLTTAKIEYGCDITEIPHACFRYSNLKYINIPRSVTRIYGYAFHSCPLTEVYYDGSEDEWNAITINSYNEALNNANIYFASQGLEYVYDDDEVCSVVGVGECTNTEIMIPSRDENSDTPVAFLGNMTGEDNPDHNATFNYGNNITYLRIPENIRGIAENAFANCETIEKVRIATDISRYAFYNCANLTEVIIEPGVDFISGYAFYGCTALNSIYIPISVTEIGEFAFAHASNLNIYYEGTQWQWNQIDKANQWDGYANGKINYNQRG